MMTFESLIEPIKDLPPHERDILKRAYELSEQAHSKQKRKSGESYFVHLYEVARILIELRMDHQVIAAGLLHDIVEDTPMTLEELRVLFGDTITNLVAGVTKIDQVPLNTERDSQTKKGDREAQFLRKTLLAINDDVRVILVKLADRLHNMRTLGYLSEARQQRMARETMDIFAPLASRLGIWQMKWELEDLSFRYLEPIKYKEIAGLIAERRVERDRYVGELVQEIEDLMEEQGINAMVSGRSKHIYSIYRKMERKQLPFNQIFDVRAVRIIVDTKAQCYQVLGIIHGTWRPIKEEFDDYIAAPKGNFYQSLHTAVQVEDGKTLEVQIRTQEMHAHAEYGIAAHWLYKEGMKGQDREFERRVQHLRELLDVDKQTDSPVEFMDAVKTDLFSDRVYVFTPQGDIIDLPAKATPIDFAYYIHTDVGDRCRGAKVNGKLVSLDYQLQTNDRVEILTAKRGGPSRDWLNPNLGYATTKRAQSKIRHWFRQQDKDKMIVLGREILERELKRLGLENKMSHEQIAKLFEEAKTDDFLAKIGFGDIHPQHIATKILEKERSEQAPTEAEKAAQIMKSRRSSAPDERAEMNINGVSGMLITLAGCCNPVEGDPIIGYITVGRGVTVHRTDCRNVLNLDGQRLIAVDWGAEKATTSEMPYSVPIVLRAYDRAGLMRDVSAACADMNINMTDLRVTTQDNIATLYVTMDVEDAVQLNKLMAKFEKMPNVWEARRLTT